MVLKFTQLLCFVLTLSISAFDLKGQCTLSGPYNNTGQFQAAINLAAGPPNNCTTITLTGLARFSGNITVPPSAKLVIAGEIIMNGNSTFNSTQEVEITSTGTFTSNDNSVSIQGTTISPIGTVNGVAMLTTSGVLPVELTSFIASLFKESVTLKWTTETEINNQKFIIETSTEGEVFNRIGEIAGAGTTTEPQDYTFTHHTPSAGVNYYRLKQVDFDGTFEYSKVIAINAPGSKDIFAFPNPAKDKITLQYDYSKGAGSIQLFDALGRRVNASIGGYAGNYEVKLPEGLAKGTYWLKVERGGQVQTLPVLKE